MNSRSAAFAAGGPGVPPTLYVRNAVRPEVAPIRS